MGANFGLEHALWFAPPGVEPAETPTYRRSEAFAHVRAECRAVRDGVGLYETSNYGKYEVAGRGARAWLDRVLRLPHPQARPPGAGADAQRRRPHHRRPHDRLPAPTTAS